jgi:AAA domain
MEDRSERTRQTNSRGIQGDAFNDPPTVHPAQAQQENPQTPVLDAAEEKAQREKSYTDMSHADLVQLLRQRKTELAGPEWNAFTRQLRKDCGKRYDAAIEEHLGNSTKEISPTRRNSEDIDLEVSIFAADLSRSILTSGALQTLVVPERARIVGDWFRSGDLGYIFAPRGIGKTFFAMEMSGSITNARNFGPWAVKQAKRVLYIDGEVALDDTKSRNDKLSLASDNLFYLHHEHLFNTCGQSLDIANPVHQQVLLNLCLESNIDVLVLDNLSCLAMGIDENDSAAWSEKMLNWVLTLRRNKIATVFIQHAGRNGQMRGHSRREDPATWIISLTEVPSAGEKIGANFISQFVKNRNCANTPEPLEWVFEPCVNKTRITYMEMGALEQFKKALKDGVTKNKELADLLGVQPGTISKLAKKGERQGWVEIKRGSYSFKMPSAEDLIRNL